MKKTPLLALTALPFLLAVPASAMPAEAPTALPSATGDTVLHVSDVTSQGSDRRTAILQGWTDCLIEQGAPTIDPDSDPRPVPAENVSPTYGVTLAWPPPADAKAACADLEPVYPPALEAATNPDFAALAQTYVACLADGGIHVRLLNDENLDWTYRAGYDVPDDGAAIEDACLVGTFGSD